MYHSHLFINVGDDPDRPDWNICRRWLRNLYRVHQRLCMAFPSDLRKENDQQFLAPYDANDFPHPCELAGERDRGDAHQNGPDGRGFLFRIDYPVDPGQGCRRPVIIVQSDADRPPDWDYAFGLRKDAIDDRGRPIGNAAFLLAAPPQARPVSIAVDGEDLLLTSPQQSLHCSIRPGDLVRFRLRANPTRKVQDGSHNGKRKRVNPTLEDHTNWLAGKLEGASDSPICMQNFMPGWAYGWRTKHEPQPGTPMQWWSVLFEGTFRVRDTRILKRLLETGIGSGKAFGFGLLSIAPVRL
jgi:CRISPR-associated protein Cas6/Cse3/CasE subtype I-E